MKRCMIGGQVGTADKPTFRIGIAERGEADRGGNPYPFGTYGEPFRSHRLGEAGKAGLCARRVEAGKEKEERSIRTPPETCQRIAAGGDQSPELGGDRTVGLCSQVAPQSLQLLDSQEGDRSLIAAPLCSQQLAPELLAERGLTQQPTHPIAAYLLCGYRRTRDLRLHPCQQLRWLEGFHQVIVGAKIEAADDVLHPVLCGEQNDGQSA